MVKGGNFQEESRIWLKKFRNILFSSFPVITVQKNTKNDQIHQLLLEKSQLQVKIQEITKGSLSQHERLKFIFNFETQIEQLDIKIASISAEKNAKHIRDQYTNLSEFGNFSCQKMCSIKQIVLNEKNEPPTAKLDKMGNLICN